MNYYLINNYYLNILLSKYDTQFYKGLLIKATGWNLITVVTQVSVVVVVFFFGYSVVYSSCSVPI